MPFKIVEEQQKFKFEVNGAGLPVAHVVRWGAGVWVKCCPLCGGLHEILKGQTEGEHTPRCLIREWARPDYKAWLERFPDAAKYTRVLLIAVGSPQGEKTIVPDSTSNNVVKPDSPAGAMKPAQIAPYAENLRKPEILPIPTGKRTRRKKREQVAVPL